jgi:hypothetical protein
LRLDQVFPVNSRTPQNYSMTHTVNLKPTSKTAIRFRIRALAGYSSKRRQAARKLAIITGSKTHSRPYMPGLDRYEADLARICLMLFALVHDL